MPRYDFSCVDCGRVEEFIKPMRASLDPELCVCGSSMDRIFTPIQISTSNCQFQPHFNYGLGKEVHSKRQMDNEVRRIRGETGKNIVEVGTDTLESVKKQKQSYKLNAKDVGEVLSGHH